MNCRDINTSNIVLKEGGAIKLELKPEEGAEGPTKEMPLKFRVPCFRNTSSIKSSENNYTLKLGKESEEVCETLNQIQQSIELAISDNVKSGKL